MKYDIVPISKPRMTQRDKWLDPPRPCVATYRRFVWECNLQRVALPLSGAEIIFILPMPESWSMKKREEADGKAHTERPDVDNLLKALSDAIYGDDSGVWDVRVTKRWGREGAIVINVPIEMPATSRG